MDKTVLLDLEMTGTTLVELVKEAQDRYDLDLCFYDDKGPNGLPVIAFAGDYDDLALWLMETSYAQDWDDVSEFIN